MTGTDAYHSSNGLSSVTDGSADESTAKFDRDELVRGWRAYEEAQPRILPLVRFAAKTDMGQVRENNEDKFDFYEPESPAILAARGCLYAVADGIGGAQAGQIASEMMLKNMIAGYYDSPAPDLGAAIHDAIAAANDRIYHLAQMIPERNGMGTTLVGAIFIEDQVIIAQVGDSRAYLVRGGQAIQVTQDHSWVEEQVRAGVMTRQDAESSPFRNVITRSIGSMPQVQPDLYVEAAQIGDIWVLCSDGLSGYVNEAEIGQIAGNNPPSEAARQFIELANARGGRDNITVFVLSVRDLLSGSPVSPAPSLAQTTANGVSQNTPSPATNGVSYDTPTPSEERQKGGLRKLFGR